MRLSWYGFATGLLASAASSAQSFEATGPVWAGDAVVGEVRDVVVTPKKWLSPTRLSFALPVGDGDQVGLLQGVLDLAAEGSHMAGRVCRPTPLVEEERTSDGFRIELLPSARAEIVSRSRQGVSVRVPAPTSQAFGEERLVPERALALRCEATDVALASLTCAPFTLRSRADDAATSFEVDAVRAVTSEVRADGWHVVAIDDFDGFRWHGFSRTRPECSAPPAGEGHGVPGSQVGMPEPSCWQGLLPRGAVLRGADRKTAVLSAKRSFEARLCLTEHPFEWQVETSSGNGTVVVRGFFDGAPVAPQSERMNRNH